MTIKLDWHGADVKRHLDQEAERALGDAAEFLLEEANRTVPFEEGPLAGSGATDVDGSSATISYDTPYAARLHEHPEYHFQHGRRGRWLELTLSEQLHRVRDFLADRLERVF